MSEPTTTTVPASDLDRLAERVERAATLVSQLREERDRLLQEREALQRRLKELETQLQGQDAGAVVHELSALRKEQREWTVERRDVAGRIETLVKKLERLEV